MVAVVGDLFANEGGFHSVNENVRTAGERIPFQFTGDRLRDYTAT